MNPCASQSTKGRTGGRKVQVFALVVFFLTGAALVLVILLFYVLFTCYFDYLFLHELFSLEFRLAQFYPLKYLMASPQQNSAK